ncbi:MAG TPA: ATP-binding protein, partial [Kofleriaceae bacterium]|nr:ATP-binding protein [Kofleriaceae bacterium]
SPIDLSRSLGLNLAAIVGVSILALNLATQLQRTSASLASERTAAADLLTLHSDIVRCLSSGLLTVDPWDMVLTVNLSACEILSTTPARAVGAPVEKLLPGLSAQMTGLGAKGALQRGELTVARPGQLDLVIGISVSPLADHGGRFLGRVVNFQDLTDLRKMEVSVKQAERLAVVGGLAAAVAHEIRNPLASISGSIELLGQMPQSDEDSRALMGIVTREIDRLNGLLTDLLDYANPRPLKAAPIDLAELVRDTVRVFGQDRGLAGVTVDTRMDDRADGVPYHGDAAKLRQVLWNLIRNAAEAAAQGGGHVVVELRPGAHEVAVRVRDDGPGIPREHRERVFEPFFTTKSRGSGLGLATVINLVNDHRGTVQLESQPGRGTCLTVRLPYTAERGRPATHAEERER